MYTAECTTINRITSMKDLTYLYEMRILHIGVNCLSLVAAPLDVCEVIRGWDVLP